MANVLGVRAWVFWWATLTATIFLQDWLRRLAEFFRNREVFTPRIPPFNIVTGLNQLIDSSADNIQRTVRFNPSTVLAGAGAFSIYNWMIAALLGIIILVVAALLYLRALQSSALIDDFVALLALYFVIRIEAHLVSIARFAVLSGAGTALLQNPAISFGLLMALLLVLAFFGEGMRDPQSFWRGMLEALLVAILLFPTETAGAVAAGLDALAAFGRLVQTNLTFGLLWGLVGFVLAVRRLYVVGVKA